MELPGTQTTESTMSSEKSVIVLPPKPRQVCPICGTASYSLGGVHPQCALKQADEPRLEKMRATKAAEPKVKKPPRHSWQKKCPQCGLQSHVNRKVCSCGHNFVG